MREVANVYSPRCQKSRGPLNLLLRLRHPAAAAAAKAPLECEPKVAVPVAVAKLIDRAVRIEPVREEDQPVPCGMRIHEIVDVEPDRGPRVRPIFQECRAKGATVEIGVEFIGPI